MALSRWASDWMDKRREKETNRETGQERRVKSLRVKVKFQQKCIWWQRRQWRWK